jgi:hypothetical protein
MLKSERFSFLLVVALILICVGIASASASVLNNKSLEEMTSKSVQEVQKKPEEAAKSIITNYFTAIEKMGNSDGIPLDSFRIVKVDKTDPNDIKVAVVLKYADMDEWSAIDYSVIRVNDMYQVQKQSCVLDSIPDSPTKGIIKCSKNFVTDRNGSVVIGN